MEEMFRTHKEPAWGWASVLDDWRRSRTRRRLRGSAAVLKPAAR